jgi:hypothetical protein
LNSDRKIPDGKSWNHKSFPGSGVEWHPPRPAEIPPPTYWPMMLALAATLMLLGILTSYLFTFVGFLLGGLSLYQWVGELRR